MAQRSDVDVRAQQAYDSRKIRLWVVYVDDFPARMQSVGPKRRVKQAIVSRRDTRGRDR